METPVVTRTLRQWKYEVTTRLIPVFGAVVLSFGVGCQVPELPEDAGFIRAQGPAEGVDSPAPETFPPVSRRTMLQSARAYAGHVWVASERNVLHGYDREGIRVDTPDAGYSEAGVRPGWWRVGASNQGVPYQWGGFSTVASFDLGLRNGMPAGDVLSPSKRQMLSTGENVISKDAVGIDSSGFISRCWQLPRPYSTEELAQLAIPLADYSELQPGDILNLKGVHVILFERFANSNQRGLLGYEAGSPPSWKVLYDFLPVPHLKRLGYQPMRYPNVLNDLSRDDLTPTPEEATEPTETLEPSL